MNTTENEPQEDIASIDSLPRVEGFWDENVCGAHFVDTEFRDRHQFTPEFYAVYRDFRYRKEHHLNNVIDWESAKGKSVLEVGLGLGADASRWASHADKFTGLDLTVEAVTATRRHFEILGLKGDIRQGNAERLPFEDNTFDLISSHGVLHHTEDIRKAMREIHRVLKPQGTFIVMLYTKNSFNYWIRIQGLFRFLFLIQRMKSRHGMHVKEPWASHLCNAKEDDQYFTWSGWPHHCTDGPDCRIANIYTWKQIKKILSEAGFQVERGAKTHFPIGLTPGIEQPLARLIGFYQFAWCKKHAQ